MTNEVDVGTAPSIDTGNSDDDDRQKPPVSPFITTSDIVNQLNKQLALLTAPSEPSDGVGRGGSWSDGSVHGSSSNNNNSIISLENLRQQPRFELQKRLPDGSAVPATADEISAADFKTKLEQAAKFVSQLATSRDRQYWAEQQRRLGNSYFASGDYKSAMDVYLTCLLVKENTPDFVNLTLVPVLNNLAQCTLQLGMYKKTIAFCSIAIEEMGKVHNQNNGDNDKEERKEECETINLERVKQFENNVQHMSCSSSRSSPASSSVDALALCKIYFKKAKAERLSGLYRASRQDLNYAADFLGQKGHEISKNEDKNGDEAEKQTKTKNDFVDQASNYIENTNNDETRKNDLSLEQYRQAIQKEFRSLDIAEKEARRNQQRQKRAMQQLLGNNALYGDKSSSSPPPPSMMGNNFDSAATSRQFSTLRARKVNRSVDQSAGAGNDQNRLRKTEASRARKDFTDCDYAYNSIVRYYWDMVARTIRSLLTMLGDDDVHVDGVIKEADGGGKSDHSGGERE